MAAHRRTSTLLALLVGLAGGYLLGTSGALVPDEPAAPWNEVNRSAYAVSHILFLIDKDHPATAARRLADRAYGQVMGGADFAEVARKQSQHEASLPAGGFLGFLTPERDSIFMGAIQALRPGEISAPVQTSNSLHIIKRHTLEEGRALEKRYMIPTHGVFVPWAEIRGGPPDRTRGQALEIAKKLAEDLRAGKTTLVEAMQQHTPPEQQRSGAWLGMTTPGQEGGVPYEALEVAEPGEYVGPLQMNQGWAVLQRGRYFRSLVKHILVQHVYAEDRDLRVTRSPDEAEELARRILAEVQAKPSEWDDFVDRFSDDPASRVRGGSLGVVAHGDLPGEVGDVVVEMEPGTIHPEPVRTAKGFHVVWRVD